MTGSPRLKASLRSESDARAELNRPRPEIAELIIEPVEFYFVWTKTGHVPRHCHNTLEAAEAEASRLARLKPYGKKYIVLRAINKRHVLPDAVESPSIPVRAGVHSERVSA